MSMALGSFTKQLAAQALGNTVDSVLDSRAEKPVPPVQPESLCSIIVGQVQAMQKALKDDQELWVLYSAATEKIRVFEIYVPSPQLLVLSGTDSDKNMTRVISPAESVQLVCKVMKVPPGSKPVRVSCIAPKPKSD